MAHGQILPFSEEEKVNQYVKCTKAEKRKFEETTSLSEIAFLPKARVDVRSIDQKSVRLNGGIVSY